MTNDFPTQAKSTTLNSPFLSSLSHISHLSSLKQSVLFLFHTSDHLSIFHFSTVKLFLLPRTHIKTPVSRLQCKLQPERRATGTGDAQTRHRPQTLCLGRIDQECCDDNSCLSNTFTLLERLQSNWVHGQLTPRTMPFAQCRMSNISSLRISSGVAQTSLQRWNVPAPGQGNV